MKLAIHTIQKTLFSGEAEKLIARTDTGEITILDGHIPLITTLRPSALEIVEQSGQRSAIFIRSGFLEVRPQSDVVILAEPADSQKQP